MNDSQFIFDDNYEFTMPTSSEDMAILIPAFIALEYHHPGTLKHCFRILSLIMDNWRITSTVSDKSRSLLAQEEFEKWLWSF